MKPHEEAKTRFLDGMRVTRQHLDHLQDTLLAGVVWLRQALGSGKICYGLKVEASGPDKVKVSPGLAFDGQARPVVLDEEREVTIGGDFGSAYLAAAYALRSAGLIDGVPTLLSHDLKLEVRGAAPPYEDDAVPVAELTRDENGWRVIQKGEWYLPPADHHHTGRFLSDAASLWRYDGAPVGFQKPGFDSGFVPLLPEGQVRLAHNLKTTDLLVQLQARTADGVITLEGLGISFWYELVGDQEISLVRGPAEVAAELSLRATIWPFSTAGAGPLLPIADAGADMVVEVGQSFILDASKSRAFGGRQLVNYIWIQMS